MRGDSIFVRTLQGSKGRDEGSECTQPLPYNSVRDFQIRQTAGRSRVTLAQEPGRLNNYTAMISTAPFFDDVRACQDAVRQRFLSQNGRGSYIDFDGFAERDGQGPGRELVRNNRSRARETIKGRGGARRPNESRDLTYSCVVDLRQNQVLSAVYQYAGNALRTNDRPNDRKQLR
jgi:hypothetical protein